MRTSLFLSVVVLPALLTPASAQVLPPLPGHGAAPLLSVRLQPPPGVKVTFYQGMATPREVAAPVVVGLRPGYVFRVKMTGFADHPGLTLYPTLEVRGTLQLPARAQPADYPAPVVLTQSDIDRVVSGSLLVKVIYLEHPERAVAVATKADQPLELEVPPDRDPIVEARALGRPVLILRLGGREVSAEELAAHSVPGTILFPGERVIPPPKLPPWVPWACFPIYDPILGPRPAEEECLHDGGDVGARAGLDQNNRLQGLDPSDTVAEYSDNQGRRRLAVSNRICLCVPRFAAVRTEIPLARHESVIEVGGVKHVQGQVQVNAPIPSRQALLYEQPRGVRGRARPTSTITTWGLDRIVRIEVLHAIVMDLGPAQLIGTAGILTLTEVQKTKLLRQIELARELSRPTGPREVDHVTGVAVAGRVEGLNVISTASETRDLTCVCNEPPRLPEKPLHVCKWASAQTAQVGDVVTFYIKLSNHGGQPITDVAVSDSLTSRLEYVPGSSRSDRDAVFTMQQNEAGSVVLRWEVGGKLLPGQSGVLSFRAKVR